jgi:hypothetical protein
LRSRRDRCGHRPTITAGTLEFGSTRPISYTGADRPGDKSLCGRTKSVRRAGYPLPNDAGPFSSGATCDIRSPGYSGTRHIESVSDDSIHADAQRATNNIFACGSGPAPGV